MKCQKCGYSFSDYKDKFCANCGVYFVLFKPHEKVVLSIGLVLALITGVGVAGLLYILYNVLIWNIFT